jgi:hypothetical protein
VDNRVSPIVAGSGGPAYRWRLELPWGSVMGGVYEGDREQVESRVQGLADRLIEVEKSQRKRLAEKFGE